MSFVRENLKFSKILRNKISSWVENYPPTDEEVEPFKKRLEKNLFRKLIIGCILAERHDLTSSQWLIFFFFFFFNFCKFPSFHEARIDRARPLRGTDITSSARIRILN